MKTVDVDARDAVVVTTVVVLLLTAVDARVVVVVAIAVEHDADFDDADIFFLSGQTFH